MLLSDISIKRPVFTVMVTLGLMTLGLLGMRNLSVDLFPDVAFPVVTVESVYPGASPEEVERLVSKPIEEVVSTLNGVDEVRSYSRDSVSTVVIQFKLETDLQTIATDVRDKVSSIRALLPEALKEPIIQRQDPTALPILTYTVSSQRDPSETRRLTEDVIKPRIESIQGVGAVNVAGGLQRELHVYVDRHRLESLGLSLVQVAQQLGQDSFDLPGGRVTQDRGEVMLKTRGRFRSLEELAGMVVASLPNGSQIRLSEVARIEDGYKEQRTRTRLNGEEGVVFEVQKQGGGNTVAIADAVYKVVDELRAVLPPDVKLVNAIDSSTFIRLNVRDVTEAILFGGAMAILIVFLFMLDWRSTLISSLALPTSVVATFLAMWLLDFSFNIMSLMGLSLAIGLLIDDAVVVRENIYRHMERGEDPVTAARNGTAEIGLAVMATTFTIIAVFVPVAFMSDMVGQMFKQFGLTVAAAVLVSLFVSFTLDPMMSARVVKAIEPGHREKQKQHRFYGPLLRFYEAMDAYYRDVLRWALSHRKTVVFASTGMLLFTLSLVHMMGHEFFPASDRGEFRVSLELPSGVSFEEMDRVTRHAEEMIRQHPEVKTLFTLVGPGEEVNKAHIRVYTSKKTERRQGQWAIQDELRERLATIPSLTFAISDLAMVEGPGHDTPVTLYVRGDDYGVLQRSAGEALQIIRSTRGVKDADTSFRAGKPELSIPVDRSRAADLGVSVGMVAQLVRLAFEGEVVAKYRQGERDWDVRLQLSPEDRRSLEALRTLTVPATQQRLGGGAGAMMAAMAQGPRLVRLLDIAPLTPEIGPSTIERMNRERQITITANLANRSLGEVVTELESQLARIDRPPGLSFVFGGQAKRMQETFSNIGLALGVAILFIYFVLASQFESFIHPFTIMLALPLAIIGALLMLFLSGHALGMAAMIGIILLMGLVTKNAILLVDYTNELRARGRSLLEALLEAGPTRLRPILMTSAAMVLGMLPPALSRGEGSEFRSAMAIAVIGGVITSTLLTLVVVPVVYTWMDRFTLGGRKEAAQPPSHEVVSLPSSEPVDEKLPGHVALHKGQP